MGTNWSAVLCRYPVQTSADTERKTVSQHHALGREASSESRHRQRSKRERELVNQRAGGA